MQTIADVVGVTKMTVSNAFSRPSHVSAALRERILATAHELGYAGPDAAGRALARGRTGVVGLLLTDSPEDAFADEVAVGFVTAVARALTPRALSLVLLSGGGRGDLCPARDVPMDGAIVYSGSLDTSSLDWLVRRRLPLVLVDRPRRPGISSVSVANVEGAAAAARHLLDLGHRRIGIATSWADAVDGVENPTPGEHILGQHRDRMRGWTETLRAQGAEVVLASRPHEVDHDDAVEIGTTLLLRTPRPTAVLCFSDLLALGVVEAASRLGLRVPEDLSVVGFDDSVVAMRSAPPLTTVRQDLDLKGRTAVSSLLRLMDGRDTGRATRARHLVVPTSLVVRGSTGPAR